MTDKELGELIGGIRIGEDQAAAIRRYVHDVEVQYTYMVASLKDAEQKLKRMRKLLNKALGIMQ
jgi:5-bromo-4-chloroindolyl phosphate hydrolysis protein